ncbi:MAG: hypothetical protein WB297_18255, partial [Actinomycetota bacterium]
PCLRYPALVLGLQGSLCVHRNEVVGGRARPFRSARHRAKMLRLELLKVKADLERELKDLILTTLEVRPRRVLGQRSRRFPRPLGAQRARAARFA